MKKLMIAACAIALAAVTQAATVQWSASGVYTKGSTTDKAPTSYIAYFISSADYALASATADLVSGSAAFVDTYGKAGANFKLNSQSAPTGSASATITESAGNSEAWTGYLVILTDDTSSGYAYITSEVTKSTGATGQKATLSYSNLTGTQTDANWYALGSAPVPEPTSGLLMLIGLGAMALRRRRA